MIASGFMKSVMGVIVLGLIVGVGLWFFSRTRPIIDGVLNSSVGRVPGLGGNVAQSTSLTDIIGGA